MNLHYVWKCCLIRLTPKQFTASVCGHRTKRTDEVHAFGDHMITTAPLENGAPPYCHRCVEKAAIACARCGGAIFPTDEPVNLCSPADPKNFVIRPGAVVYQKDPLILVGCLRWNCADSGASRAGFWVMPGKVERVASPFELALAASDCQPIFVEDIGSLAEARRLEREILSR